MRKVYLLLLSGCLLMPGKVSAQAKGDIPRDTTYTLRSATEKLKKNYPFIVPVKARLDGDVWIEHNRVYRTVKDRALHLDLFRPENAGIEKLPCIICIHGGGWASGDKSLLIPMAQELTKYGYITATVEYRLSPEAQYPAGVIDVTESIKWIRDNAASFNIDTTRIALLGTSAGATIATLVGNTAESELYRPVDHKLSSTSRVQAIINIDGILDFSDPAESGKDHDPAKPSAAARWFGITFKEDPGPWMEASPLRYAGPHSPSTLFINSAIPRFHAGRDAYIKVLGKEGIHCEVHTIPESPHSFWLFYPWFDPTIRYIDEFLDKIW